MSTISELFPRCNKLAYDARQQLLQLQQQSLSSTASSSAAAFDVVNLLDQLDRQLDHLQEDCVLREPPAQREKWKRKITTLRAQSATLRQEYQNWYNSSSSQSYQSHNRYHSDRQEVLRRRPNAGNANGTSSNNHHDVDHLASEAESLEQSHLMVNQLLDQGAANLHDLQKQRAQLRGIRGMMTNIGNTLGLTQATMRIIERRDVTDAYLVAGGMVVTLVVLYVVWYVI